MFKFGNKKTTGVIEALTLDASQKRNMHGAAIEQLNKIINEAQAELNEHKISYRALDDMLLNLNSRNIKSMEPYLDEMAKDISEELTIEVNGERHFSGKGIDALNELTAPSFLKRDYHRGGNLEVTVKGALVGHGGPEAIAPDEPFLTPSEAAKKAC